MSKNLFIGLTTCLVAQVLVWFQINAQFMWPWAIKHKIFFAISIGSVISLCFVDGVSRIIKEMNGQLWAGRLIPNALGLLVFTILTWIFTKQGIDLKTGVCIFLSIMILFVQLFWK